MTTSFNKEANYILIENDLTFKDFVNFGHELSISSLKEFQAMENLMSVSCKKKKDRKLNGREERQFYGTRLSHWHGSGVSDYMGLVP